MKDLVLIGSINESATSEWQQRTAASAIARLAPDALLLSGTSGDPTPIEQAHAVGLDAFFRHPPLRAADFRLLAMDMDSTLITIECIDEIADMVGVKPQVAAITEAAMRGELDFPGALRRRVALLKGLPVEALDRVYNERLRLSPGAENLLAAARKAGWTTLLVSGGFTYFTNRLQQRLGLDHTLANTLEVIEGKLTGEVLGEIVDATVKAARVKAACDALGCSTAQAIVAGDGANDLQMMRIAGLSVAFRAKPVVRREATLSINHAGLDALLHRLT
jgi:phosphoserine phosphatase